MPLAGSGVQIDFTSRVDEVIANSKRVVAEMERVKDETKNANRAIEEQARKAEQAAQKQKQSWTEFRSMYSTVVDVLRTGKRVFDEIIGSTQKYASQVRDLAAISGTGAEQSSRLLQVLDDFQISAENVNTAVRAMTKEGLTPTVETLAVLSDKYLAINDAQERNEFILKNLGRSGLEWVNVLQQGGQAIRDLSAGVNENLILTDAQVRAAEEYRLKVDQLSDSWQGLKISAGNDAIPFIGRTLDELNNNITENGTVLGILRFGFDDLFRAIKGEDIDSATQSYTAMAYAIENTDTQTEELTQDTSDLDRASKDFLTTVMSVQDTQAKYTETTSALREEEARLLEQKQQLIDQGYSPEGQKIADVNSLLDENKSKQEEAAGAMEKATARMVASLAERELATDGWQAADTQAMLKIYENLGLLSKESVVTANAMINEAHNMAQAGGIINESITPSFTSLTREETRAFMAANRVRGQLDKLGEINGSKYDFFVNIITRGSIPNLNALNRANNAQIGNCFVPGTLIHMADGSHKPIEDIEKGEWVLSRNLKTGQNINTQIGDVLRHTADEMGEYYLIINEMIGVTPNHPLYVNGAWQNAGTLKYGDILTTPDGELAVVSILQVYKQTETYNLHIDDDNHNYFADGILAHNKTGGGQINAPGDGSMDTVLVPLANDEFVINATQARKFLPLLEAINEGKLNGMAGGGSVGGRTPTGSFGSRVSSLGSVGGRTPKGSFGSRTGLSITPSLGGGGQTPAQAEQAAADMSANIAQTVAGNIGGNINTVIAANPQIQAIAQTVDELKQMNENMITLIAKTASAGDIGRSVRSAQALVA